MWHVNWQTTWPWFRVLSLYYIVSDLKFYQTQQSEIRYVLIKFKKSLIFIMCLEYSIGYYFLHIYIYFGVFLWNRSKSQNSCDQLLCLEYTASCSWLKVRSVQDSVSSRIRYRKVLAIYKIQKWFLKLKKIVLDYTCCFNLSYQVLASYMLMTSFVDFEKD